jgi:hypothetical protein
VRVRAGAAFVIELAPGERIAVIGFDYRHALGWARWESGLRSDQVIIVGEPTQLRGVPHGVRFVLLGGFYERRNWREFADMLRARNAQEVVW